MENNSTIINKIELLNKELLKLQTQSINITIQMNKLQTQSENMTIQMNNIKSEIEKIREQFNLNIEQSEISKNTLITNDLTEEINNTTKIFSQVPEKYIDFLKFITRFRQYSINNCILIYNNNPNVSYVASFNHLKQLGYNITKGQKAIKIIVPDVKVQYQIGDKIKSYYELTNAEKFEVGKGKVKTIKKTSFLKDYVFDISQTDISKDILQNIINYYDNKNLDVKDKIKIMEQYLENNSIKISYKTNDFEAYKKAYFNDKLIVVSDKNDDKKLSNLIPGIYKSILTNDRNLIENKTNIKELQLQSIEFMINKYFNIPNKDEKILDIGKNIQSLTKEEIKQYIYPILNKTKSIIKQCDEIQEKNLEKYIQTKKEKNKDKYKKEKETFER